MRPALVTVGLLALALTACSSSGTSLRGAKSAARCPTDSGLTGNVADHGAKAAGGTGVTIDARDFFFSPTCVTAAPAGAVTLTVHNGGLALHNVSIPNQGIDTDIDPGQTITVKVNVGGSAVAYFCKYHRTSGMVGSVIPGAG